VDALIGWAMIGAALWLSWPGFTTGRQRLALVALVLLFPLVSWVWTITRGVRARRARHEDQRLAQLREQSVRRARDISYWRDQRAVAATLGAVRDQQLAEDVLDTLGATYCQPETPTPHDGW
jgi:hypothetical protein